MYTAAQLAPDSALDRARIIAAWPALGRLGAGQCLGVTEVLDVLTSSEALKRWAAAEERRACLAGVATGEFAYVAATRAAQDRGARVHARIQERLQQIAGYDSAWLDGGATSEVEPGDAPAVVAFESWLATRRPRVVACERTVHSLLYRYAGTLDLLAEVDGRDGVRRLVVVDWKTGDGTVQQRSRVQVAAYAQAAHECGVASVPSDCLVVGLPRDEATRRRLAGRRGGMPYVESWLPPERVQPHLLAFFMAARLREALDAATVRERTA